MPAQSSGTISTQLHTMDHAASAGIALIRGINVGTAKRVAMTELRAHLERRGLADVATLLNSGNVVFTPPRAGLPTAARLIADTLREDCGVAAEVVALSAAELGAIIGACPMQAPPDPSRLFVTVYGTPANRTRYAALTQQDWSPDQLWLGQAALYAWCTGGATGSLLAKAVGKAMGKSCTTRNWATLQRLAVLAAGQAGVA
jgi:uncharacterized protein (DUF1697 family)